MSLWSEQGYQFDFQPATTIHGLKEAGLDKTVLKTNVEGTTEDGQDIHVDDHYVTYEADTGNPLGVVGDRYSVVQPRTWAELIDVTVNQHTDITFQCAGTFDGGSKHWVLLNLPFSLPVNGREIQANMLYKNSFDGSGTVEAMAFAEDLICENGLTAMTTSGTIKIRHTQSAEGRIETAKEALQQAFNEFEDMKEAIDTWLDSPFYISDMEQFADKLFPTDEDGERSTKAENDREELIECYRDPIGPISGFEGTAYQAYNALTEFVTHHKTVRASGDKTETEARLQSVYGTNGSGKRFERKGVKTLNRMIN